MNYDLVLLIDDFLTNRKQRVTYNTDGYTEWKSVTSGVPHGSIMGPLLFATYLNSYSVHDSQRTCCVAYADDISILHHIPENETDNMQIEANQLSDWAEYNQLKINTKKTKSITFARYNMNPVTQLNISSNLIEECTNLKLLGIIFSSNLHWKDHIDIVISKSWRAMAIIRKLRSFGCEKHVLWEAFLSLVFCYSCYSWPAWCDIDANSFKRIQPIIKLISIWSGREISLSMIREKLNSSCYKLKTNIVKNFHRHPLSRFFILSDNSRYSLRSNGILLKPAFFKSKHSRNSILKFC